MRPSTEDLLALRDGEPLDARARAKIEATPAYGCEIARLQRMQRALRSLQMLEAPPEVLDRVLAAEKANGVVRSRRSWLVAGAGVAAVATAAIAYVTTSGGPGDDGEAAPVPVVAGRELETPLPAAGSYGALVEESARLERLLAELPAQSPLMTGATASTIAGLEDRIAFVDEQLVYGAARKLPVPQQAALWSDRVELMNALVNVRYAEAQSGGY
ncbi:MAG TPA: hypothetical protein VHH11_17080 [Gammaproteobacteria bacterium]|jgi:hypothetical protein|nr:hypothetical protein [Gammaproteobacteria bacterium]